MKIKPLVIYALKKYFSTQQLRQYISTCYTIAYAWNKIEQFKHFKSEMIPTCVP